MNFDVTSLIILGISLVLCFCGYKVQKFVVTLAWFALGYTVAGMIGDNFVTGNTLLIIKLVAGIILGSMGFKLEKLALAIAVAYLTYISVGPYITGFEKEVTIIIQVAVSLLAGRLATFFIKPILIGVTAVAGATLIKQHLPVIIPSLGAQVTLIIAIVIAVLGLLTQFKTNK